MNLAQTASPARLRAENIHVAIMTELFEPSIRKRKFEAEQHEFELKAGIRKRNPFAIDLVEARKRFQQSQQIYNVPIVPQIRNGFDADLKAMHEVFVQDGYASPSGESHFDFQVGDSIGNCGAHIGSLEAWCRLKRRDFCITGTSYEPSVFSHKLLRYHVGDDFQVVTKAVGSVVGQVVFRDHTFSTSGAWKSCIKDAEIQPRRSVLEYVVQVESFQAAISNHSVMKVDIEGSELAIFSRTWEWNQTRLLLLEFSAHRLRTEYPNGAGWECFATAIDNLRTGGFEHAFIEGKAYKLSFWKKDWKRGGDFRAWFFRPCGRDMMRTQRPAITRSARSIHWLDFRAHLRHQSLE